MNQNIIKFVMPTKCNPLSFNELLVYSHLCKYHKFGTICKWNKSLCAGELTLNRRTIDNAIKTLQEHRFIDGKTPTYRPDMFKTKLKCHKSFCDNYQYWRFNLNEFEGFSLRARAIYCLSYSFAVKGSIVWGRTLATMLRISKNTITHELENLTRYVRLPRYVAHSEYLPARKEKKRAISKTLSPVIENIVNTPSRCLENPVASKPAISPIDDIKTLHDENIPIPKSSGEYIIGADILNEMATSKAIYEENKYKEKQLRAKYETQIKTAMDQARAKNKGGVLAMKINEAVNNGEQELCNILNIAVIVN